MTILSEMPPVKRCSATSCAYNVAQGCHAKAVTIGGDDVPACDTFLGAPHHTRAAQRVAGVGACKVASCRFNDDYECTAQDIVVGQASGMIRCETYARR